VHTMSRFHCDAISRLAGFYRYIEQLRGHRNFQRSKGTIEPPQDSVSQPDE
jgi:hypothetical protein